MGNESTTRFTIDSDPASVRTFLQPLLGLVHQGFDVSVPRAHEFFEADRAPIDRYLFPHIVRYHMKRYLSSHGQEVREEEADNSAPLQIDEIAFSGLSLAYEGFKVRILKAHDAGLPFATTSRRQEFYQQRWLEFPDEDYSERWLNLVVLWDVDANYTFSGLSLACPKDGGPKSAQAHWQVPVPNPVLSVQGPDTQQPIDDLDELKLKTPAETGTARE